MGCGINFLSDNLVDAAVVTLTTGTENSQFPLQNIKNEATAIKFRSLENTVVIVFDFQQTRTIDAVAIHGDTNNSLGLTSASLKTSLTTDFSMSAVTNIPLSAKYLLGYEYLTPVSHRYAELTLTGTGVYCELSNIFIGERVNIEQNNLSIDSFRYGFRDNSEVSANNYDQLFVDKRNSTKFVAGDIQFCTKDEMDQIDEIFLRHQRSSSLWVIIDKDSESMIDAAYKLTTYGYFQAAPQWSAAGGRHYSTSIRINQAG